MSDSFEIVRMGEMRRSVEQTAVFDSPSAGYTVGLIRGLDRSVARTALGVFEVVTFPLPPYQPMFTSYVKPGPVYPRKLQAGPDFGQACLTPTPTWASAAAMSRRSSRQPVPCVRQLNLVGINLSDAPVVFRWRVLL